MVPDKPLISFLFQVIKLILRDPIMVLPTATTSLVRLTSAPSPRIAATTTTLTTPVTISAPVELSLKCFASGFLLNSFMVGVVNCLTEGTDCFNVGFVGKRCHRSSAQVFCNGICLHLMVNHILVQCHMRLNGTIKTINVPGFQILGRIRRQSLMIL